MSIRKEVFTGKNPHEPSAHKKHINYAFGYFLAQPRRLRYQFEIPIHLSTGLYAFVSILQ